MKEFRGGQQILSLVFQVTQYHTKSSFYRQNKLSLTPHMYWHEIKDLLFIHGCLNGKYNINIHNFVKLAPESNLHNSCPNKFKHFQQSFFIRSCRLWNLLPKVLKLNSSIAKFKKPLKRRYKTAISSNYNLDIMHTWRSICFKCEHIQGISSSNFTMCCYCSFSN